MVKFGLLFILTFGHTAWRRSEERLLTFKAYLKQKACSERSKTKFLAIKYWPNFLLFRDNGGRTTVERSRPFGPPFIRRLEVDGGRPCSNFFIHLSEEAKASFWFLSLKCAAHAPSRCSRRPFRHGRCLWSFNYLPTCTYLPWLTNLNLFLLQCSHSLFSLLSLSLT